jgi:Predicted membrane protein (DUF2207) N-terminal domain/Predicted membrane protein (DUF2207) C-terminal domain
MRGVSAFAAAVALAIVPALPAAAASDGDGERITSYDVQLAVQTDGSMRVQETIGYDFGGNQRHGIERRIDTEQRYDDTRDRRFPVSAVTASSADAPADVQVSGDDAETTIRIGDPDRTVTGRHSYRIGYSVAAATTRLADHDELYWNAFGPNWRVPVQAIAVRVSGAPVTKATCFMGRPGSIAGCPLAVASGSTAGYRGGPLGPGGVLTVVAAFPPGSVATAAPILSDRVTAGRFLAGRPAAAVPLALVFLAGPLLLLLRGRQRRRAQEAPALAYRSQFRPTPPAGLRPVLANTLLSGRFTTVDPIAVLLDLSARGYLSVTPLSTRDWRLAARHGPDGSLRPEDLTVLQAVFGSGPDTTLATAARALTRTRGRLRTMARQEVVQLGWYSSPPGAGGRVGPIALGVLMAVLAVPLTFVLGFGLHAGLAGPALFAGGILMIAYGASKPAPRTPAGEVARSQLMAFKRTLAAIDPTRLPPDQREAALAGMLPYAVALGLAPQLAAAFSAAGVVAGGHAYVSNPMWWSTFAGDATRATSPVSSSSGGGSGFSGGSAGGGGGGGGGGSW